MAAFIYLPPLRQTIVRRLFQRFGLQCVSQSRTLLFCTTFSLLLVTGHSSHVHSEDDSSSGDFVYEVRMGPIIAGELKFDFRRQHDAYEFLGHFQTSQSLSDYYAWTGTFAAKGLWQATNPVTQTYLVQSESKDDDYKVVVMSERDTQILLGRDGEFEVNPKPSGTDLISALLFTPGCYAGEHVHDGEDAYAISLDRVSDTKIRRRTGFHSGAVTRCDYSVVTRRGKTRRLRVSMAEIDGVWVATEVRIRVSFFPDPVFRLRS